MSKVLGLFSRGGSQSSTDAIRQSTSMTMAYLLEQNRKFEFFMRQKVEELEGRVSAQQQTRQDLDYEDEADYDHEIDRVEEAGPDRGESTVPAPITSADVDEPFGSPVVPLSAVAATRPMETGSPGAEKDQAETLTDAPLLTESLTDNELPENELDVSSEPDIPAEDLWLVMLGGEAETPAAAKRQPTSLVVSEWTASTEDGGNEAEPAGIEDNRLEVGTGSSELAEPETEDESAESGRGDEGSTAAEATDEPVEVGEAKMTELETKDEPAEEEFGEAWPTTEIVAGPEANDAELAEPETAGETENEKDTDAATKSMPLIGLQSQIKMSGTQAEEEEDNDSLLPSWVTAQLKN